LVYFVAATESRLFEIPIADSGVIAVTTNRTIGAQCINIDFALVTGIEV